MSQIKVQKERLLELCHEYGTNEEACKTIAAILGASYWTVRNAITRHKIVSELRETNAVKSDKPAKIRKKLKPKILSSQNVKDVEYSLLPEELAIIKGSGDDRSFFYISWADLDNFIMDLQEIKNYKE